MDEFLAKHKAWVFGHLSYELKNGIHHFQHDKNDKIGFPEVFFFVPQYLLQLRGDELYIFAEDPGKVFADIIREEIISSSPVSVFLHQTLTRQEYIRKIKALQQHIIRGDCYEINFCQEFFAERAEIDPVDTFQRLVEVSPNPFSAFYKLNALYLICASPERFLLKRQDRIFSQPMKGTVKRDHHDKKNDEQLKEELSSSAKDRSENVMVVDMVRNDLSRICEAASVKVDELFGVYSYPQVHQMISTVSGTLHPDVTFSQIIEATFPMGSMTGAPKHRVMQLIDEYELSARGIFSGSVGYIDPSGDFDFNVVIRSIMYNASDKYLSYRVGSGITFYSDPEKEWEECMLKGEAIKKVLSDS